VKYLPSLPALCVVVIATTNSFAQGYYSGTQGARAAGRAGAFTARADDLSAIELNPAGLANIGTTVIQVGNRFSYNNYDFTRQSTLDWGNVDSSGAPPNVQFATAHNQKPWQYLDPMLGVASNLGLKNWGFALAAYAPAGIAREQYPADGGQRYMMLSRDSQILNYTASVAWKYREVFGIGASLLWISVPSLKYQLIINGNPLSRASSEDAVRSGTDMRATVSGSDPFTPNAVIGAWYRPAKYLQWGLSAQVMPSDIRVKGDLSVDPVSDIGDQVVLKRNGIPANDVTLTLPLPVKVREGVRYRHIRGGREVFDIELDVAYEFWSRVQRFTLETNNMKAWWGGSTIPVGRIEIQKHWHNTITIALGGDYAVIPKALTVRGGAFYISKLADPAYTSIDFVSGRQVGGTLGASILAGSAEVALAYEYRHVLPVSVNESESRVYQQAPGSPCRPPYTVQSGCNVHYLGIPAPVVNAGNYKAYSQVTSVDLLYRF
jgi:long-subunit fatty acid transport protein